MLPLDHMTVSNPEFTSHAHTITRNLHDKTKPQTKSTPTKLVMLRATDPT